MSTRIQKFGLVNGIKPRGNNYDLANMIQESYKVSYDAKKLGNEKLINLTESHLGNIKDNPTSKTLSEDLDVLKDLVSLGKDQTLKDIEEVNKKPKKTRKRSVNSCVKPMAKVKESSWSNSKDAMGKALESFRESANSKVFYKEFEKFNRNIKNNKPVTMAEAVKLYKACNSCLTHLTVTLEKNPEFRTSFKECTKLLSVDNSKLLESIQEGKLPSKSLLESFVTFTNILLESDAPEELDDKIYEDADMEELDDRDVINEEEEVVAPEEASDESVIDLTQEEIDILKSVLGKISDIDTAEGEAVEEEISDEEFVDDEVVEEDVEDIEDVEDDIEDEEFDEDIVEDEPVESEIDVTEELPEEGDFDEYSDEELEEEEDVMNVNLTPEEVSCLRAILSKVSNINEEDEIDLVDDEVEVPEMDGEDEDILDEDADMEELDDRDVINEDADMEELDDRDVINEDADMEELDDRDVINEEEEIHDIDSELSESAFRRIKKCF